MGMVVALWQVAGAWDALSFGVGLQVAVHNCTEAWLGPGTCDLRCASPAQSSHGIPESSPLGAFSRSELLCNSHNLQGTCWNPAAAVVWSVLKHKGNRWTLTDPTKCTHNSILAQLWEVYSLQEP